MNRVKILLTGASGFLGHALVSRLVESRCEIIGMSRNDPPIELAHIQWIRADLTDPKSVLREEVIQELAKVDIIIHAAALYQLDAANHSLYRQNVLSTVNILNLARILPKLPHVSLISTIAVAGDYTGAFTEEMSEKGQKFSDFYASTKFASEQLLRTAIDIPSRSIIRLGVLVGSSIDGSIPKVDGPYYIQKILYSIKGFRQALNRSRFFPFPFDEKAKLFLVPVDIAAEAIDRIVHASIQKSCFDVFHVTGETGGVSVRRVLSAMLEHYGIESEILAVSEKIIPDKLMQVLGLPPVLKVYMNQLCIFDDSIFFSCFPDFVYPEFNNYKKSMFMFADHHLFGVRAQK